MRIRSVLSKSLVATALVAAPLMLSQPADATQVPPKAPPGQATLITYYAGSADHDIVGQRTLGTCNPTVSWGSTTSYYTTSFINCGQA